ncbi:hypothetical protein D3C81_1768610 [compost metagenome]
MPFCCSSIILTLARALSFCLLRSKVITSMVPACGVLLSSMLARSSSLMARLFSPMPRRLMPRAACSLAVSGARVLACSKYAVALS